MYYPSVLYMSLIVVLVAKAAYGTKVPDSLVAMFIIMNIVDIIGGFLIKLVLFIRQEWGEPCENHYSQNYIHWDYKSQRMMEDPDENQ